MTAPNRATTGRAASGPFLGRRRGAVAASTPTTGPRCDPRERARGPSQARNPGRHGAAHVGLAAVRSQRVAHRPVVLGGSDRVGEDPRPGLGELVLADQGGGAALDDLAQIAPTRPSVAGPQAGDDLHPAPRPVAGVRHGVDADHPARHELRCHERVEHGLGGSVHGHRALELVPSVLVVAHCAPRAGVGTRAGRGLPIVPNPVSGDDGRTRPPGSIRVPTGSPPPRGTNTIMTTPKGCNSSSPVVAVRDLDRARAHDQVLGFDTAATPTATSADSPTGPG